jgi:hypothetical protein
VVLEIMVNVGSYTPMEANTAYSIDDAYSVGMEGEVGVALS